jgi:hypothetical protein
MKQQREKFWCPNEFWSYLSGTQENYKFLTWFQTFQPFTSSILMKVMEMKIKIHFKKPDKMNIYFKLIELESTRLLYEHNLECIDKWCKIAMLEITWIWRWFSLILWIYSTNRLWVLEIKDVWISTELGGIMFRESLSKPASQSEFLNNLC